MDESRKKELFPYFAYLYSQELNPEKYGQLESIEDWIKTIQENDEDAQQIVSAAEQLSDEDWQNLDDQYSKEKNTNEPIMAAKGAKLKKLKKCKCGCDMITTKDKGGKLISKCACGCKSQVKKGEKGMLIQKSVTPTKESSVKAPPVKNVSVKPITDIVPVAPTTLKKGGFVVKEKCGSKLKPKKLKPKK